MRRWIGAASVASVACLGAGLGGCSAMATIEGGYHEPLEGELAGGHRGLTIDLHYGLGPGDVPAGGELSIRTKHGSHQGQYAIGFGGYAFTPPEAVGAFARGGINLVQLETWDGDFAFGMGSPWVQGGLYLLPDAIGSDSPVHDFGGFMFTFAATTGYDLRFGDAVPNSGYWQVTAGIGFLALWGR